jgi:hypothetical protein
VISGELIQEGRRNGKKVEIIQSPLIDEFTSADIFSSWERKGEHIRRQNPHTRLPTTIFTVMFTTVLPAATSGLRLVWRKKYIPSLILPSEVKPVVDLVDLF